MSRLLLARPTCPATRFSAALPALASRRSSSTMNPRLSPGTDAEAVAPALSALLSSHGGRWALASDGQALERSFKFKTFAKTWSHQDFMTAVSLQCKIKNHHPEWSNVYNVAFVRWTTHHPRGLSEKDITLATACDAIAKDFDELQLEAPEVARDLAGRVTVAAGDCCMPRK